MASSESTVSERRIIGGDLRWCEGERFERSGDGSELPYDLSQLRLVTTLVLRDEQDPLIQVQLSEAQVGVADLSECESFPLLHRRKERGPRLGELALRRL